MSQDLATYDPSQDLAGWNPLKFAAKVQKGAEKLATNVERISGRITDTQRRVNTAVDSVTSGTRTGAEVIRATSRAGIATAATGDATSGLAAASLTTRPALILGGLALAAFVFMKSPGKRGF